MTVDVATLGQDCRAWLKATWKPFLAYLVALALTAKFADSHSRPVLLVLGAVLIGVSIWLGHVVRQERRSAEYRVARARLVVTCAMVVLGLGLVLLSRLGSSFDAVSFAGLGLVVVSLGAFVSEARFSRRWEHVRGPVLLGAAFFAIAAALVLLPPGPTFLVVLGIGLLVAQFGTELHSEDHLRALPVWSPWRTALLGLALVAVAVGLLVWAGTGPVGGWILAGVVLVVVWMAASDNDSLLIVLVIAAALVWASAPRATDADEAPDAEAGRPYFLAIGDSYISGEGAERYYEGTNTAEPNDEHTNKCRRAPTAWPVLLAQSPPQRVSDRVMFLACSGADAVNIRTDAPVDDKTGKRSGPAELVEYRERREKGGITEPPTFVALSVGGNDAGFGTIGRSCVGPGDCAELGDIFLERLRQVEPMLLETYKDVRTAVGEGVPVVVIPYPVPVRDDGSCPDVFLTQNERRFVVRFVTELNQVVRSAATRAGFHYMQTMESALTPLCDGPNAGLNFLKWNPQGGSLRETLTPTNWTHNSLHPNEGGHRAMRRAATAWLQTRPDLRPPDPAAAAPRAVPRMGQLFEFGVTRLCSPRDGDSCDLEKNGWLFEQGVRLFGSVFLPLVLYVVGAWMFIMWPIRFANERGLSAASVVARFIRRWRTS